MCAHAAEIVHLVHIHPHNGFTSDSICEYRREKNYQEKPRVDEECIISPVYFL